MEFLHYNLRKQNTFRVKSLKRLKLDRTACFEIIENSIDNFDQQFWYLLLR